MAGKDPKLAEDAMIAATAGEDGLAIATRNVRDLARFGVQTTTTSRPRSQPFVTKRGRMSKTDIRRRLTRPTEHLISVGEVEPAFG